MMRLPKTDGMRVEFRLKSLCVVLCAAGVFVGCSFMFTRGPKNDRDEDCSTSSAPPVLDTIGGLLQIVRIGLAAGATDSVYRDAPISREADIGLGVVFALLHGTSAIYGYTTTAKCRAQKKRLAEETKREQRPVQPNMPGWTAPPEGAVGFSFGSTPAQAQQTCVGAGHRWTATQPAYACSGAAMALGRTQAAVYLVFCADRLCRIDVVVRSTDAGAHESATVFGELRTEIRKRYGLPLHSDIHVPNECKAESVFIDCLARGQARGRETWQWPTGQAITLEIVAGQPGEAVVSARFTLPGVGAWPPVPPPPPAVAQPPMEADAGATIAADAGGVAPSP